MTLLTKMPQGKDHENCASLWENLSNDPLDNSRSEKVISEPEPNEVIKKRRRGDSTKKGKGEEEGVVEILEHDMHTWTERERRKRMRNMYSILQSLLPSSAAKAEKASIVEDAVNFIKTLQSSIQRLQKCKLERLQRGASNLFPSQSSVIATSKLDMFSTREGSMTDQVPTMNTYSNISLSSTPLSASASHLPITIQTWISDNVVLNIVGNDVQYSIYAPKRHGLLTTICSILDSYKMKIISATVSSEADRSFFMIQACGEIGATDKFLTGSMTMDDVYKQAAGEIIMLLSS